MSARPELEPDIAARLARGCVIPAHPLALGSDGSFDARSQLALGRYYLAAGAGGLAVGVHTTQFAIRDHGLLRAVLEVATEAAGEASARPILVAGICGPTRQAVAEAELARDLGYHLGLLSLAALGTASGSELLAHADEVGRVLPLFGFYLQDAVGGHRLPIAFWRRFLELPALRAIKVAPFDRYRTLDVIRAVAESGRSDVALYTGNDDHIVGDLVGRFRFGTTAPRFVGGLLGHWAVWTRRAVELFDALRGLPPDGALPPWVLDRATEVTRMNAALFDAPNRFAGCIAGVQQVLFGQGLLESPRCLEPAQGLSPGQQEELARAIAEHPHLIDDEFVAEHLDDWRR